MGLGAKGCKEGPATAGPRLSGPAPYRIFIPAAAASAAGPVDRSGSSRTIRTPTGADVDGQSPSALSESDVIEMIRSLLKLAGAGVPSPFLQATGMLLRKSLNEGLVNAMVVAHTAEVGIPASHLEAHYLAGGDPEALVKAAIQLRGREQQVDHRQLAAIDLGGGDLEQVVAAYAAVKEQHPDFAFDELAERVAEGEDIVAKHKTGSLAPLAVEAGWRVRVEYGPIAAADLEELLSRIRGDARVSVLRPGTVGWRPAETLGRWWKS